MTKTSSEASRTKQRVPRNGRAAFFAIKESIRADVRASHTLRSIYETHEATLGLSYRQFARYVAKYLAAERAGMPRPSASEPTAPTSRPAAPGPKRAEPEQRRGFHVDPMGMLTKKFV